MAMEIQGGNGPKMSLLFVLMVCRTLWKPWAAPELGQQKGLQQEQEQEHALRGPALALRLLELAPVAVAETSVIRESSIRCP